MNSNSIVKQKPNKPSAPTCKSVIEGGQKNNVMSIKMIEDLLLEKFPSHTACSWDRTGLLVGDLSRVVNKVCVALDVTMEAIESCQKYGANLLLTHHPAYIEPISLLLAQCKDNNFSDRRVFHAIKNDIALMNFHTALDVSEAGGQVLPKLLNLKVVSVCQPTDNLEIKKSKLGFGRLCKVKKSDSNLSLKNLAARCMSVFGREPRVWGSFSNKINKIVTTTGSTGPLFQKDGLLANVLDMDVDCLICGEIKYHDALNLTESGLNIIELGHDVSELPFVGLLASELNNIGIDKSDIILLDQTHNWKLHRSTEIN